MLGGARPGTPRTHTWDFPKMETPRTLVSYLACQLPPTAWEPFSISWLSLSASSLPEYRRIFASGPSPKDDVPLLGAIFDIWLPLLAGSFEEKMWGWGQGVGKLSFVEHLLCSRHCARGVP